MTRLLKTAIIGIWEKTVASSWIDMLAGLSMLYNFRMPPGFCASAGPVVARGHHQQGPAGPSSSKKFRRRAASDFPEVDSAAWTCRRPIKMSPLCQFEMTLPEDFAGGVWGDGSADE